MSDLTGRNIIDDLERYSFTFKDDYVHDASTTDIETFTSMFIGLTERLQTWLLVLRKVAVDNEIIDDYLKVLSNINYKNIANNDRDENKHNAYEGLQRTLYGDSTVETATGELYDIIVYTNLIASGKFFAALKTRFIVSMKLLSPVVNVDMDLLLARIEETPVIVLLPIIKELLRTQKQEEKKL